MSETPILSVENLGHSYGTDPVLSGVSFSLEAGEFLAVLGASGCGKSTLLRAIAGFVCAREGRITLGNQVVSENGVETIRAEKRGVGLVFQDYALFPHMSVADNIAFGIHRSSDRSHRVEELLELVDLSGYGGRSPNSLSGGQKQRVALARALAPKPQLLLLDEPFANLDGPIRMEVGHSIKGILRRAGAAGILVTHDRSEAMGLSDRVAVLGRGGDVSSGPAQLLQLDAPHRLFFEPVSETVAHLTGHAIVVDAQADGLRADTHFGPVELRAPATGEIAVMIRGHQLGFEPSESGAVVVVDSQFVGPGYRLLVNTPIGPQWLEHGSAQRTGTNGCITVDGPCAVVPRAS